MKINNFKLSKNKCECPLVTILLSYYIELTLGYETLASGATPINLIS